MKTHDFLEKHLKNKTLLSLLLIPFSWIYAIVVICKRKLIKYRKNYRPEVKIISIGNITVGGSGKTPFTIFLAKFLKRKGYQVAVSHRDYKGAYERDNFLLSDRSGLLDGAEKACDEAYLIAYNLIGIPVIGGKNRVNSVKKLMHKFPDLDYIILDDSFQHFKLEHDYDFVLFNHSVGIGNGRLLPAGILRESLSALKQADCIIYNGIAHLPSYLKKYSEKVLFGDYNIAGIFEDNSIKINVEEIEKLKVLLVSGIANPASYEKTVDKQNIRWIQHLKFPDHHNYTEKDLAKIAKTARTHGASTVLTTEKDYTKLRKFDISITILVLRIDFELSGNNNQIINVLKKDKLKY